LKTLHQSTIRTNMTSINIDFTMTIINTFQYFLEYTFEILKTKSRCILWTDRSSFSISSEKYFTWLTCNHPKVRIESQISAYI
jgi:hypothetical protein